MEPSGRKNALSFSEGMSLAAAELGNQGKNGRRVDGLAIKPPQHHRHVLAQRLGKAGAAEELVGVGVVLRRSPGGHLLQRDRELVGIERTPLRELLRAAARLCTRVPFVLVDQNSRPKFMRVSQNRNFSRLKTKFFSQSFICSKKSLKRTQ